MAANKKTLLSIIKEEFESTMNESGLEEYTALKKAYELASPNNKKKLIQVFPDLLSLGEQDSYTMQQGGPPPEGQQLPNSQMPISNPSGQVNEDNKKKFEIIYVPFTEIPSGLQKAFNDGSLSPEEYAARLEPFYRTTYGNGNNEDEAILSLGADFEDNNEVVNSQEQYQKNYVAEQKKTKKKNVK